MGILICNLRAKRLQHLYIPTGPLELLLVVSCRSVRENAFGNQQKMRRYEARPCSK